MNVRELIAKLQEFDPELPVVVFNDGCKMVKDSFVPLQPESVDVSDEWDVYMWGLPGPAVMING